MFEPFLNQEDIEQLIAAEQTSTKAQKRTPEQIAAIYSHGQDILVSASAGSGKTFVMVERIVDMIKRGVGINQLFISTFTVKAASELKERLEIKLSQAVMETTDPVVLEHLSSQLGQVQTAPIGTMDAFTQRLVSEHGYLLGLSPQFRILQDKAEQDGLKKEVFDDLFEDYLAGSSAQTFKRLVRNFAGQRKDASGFRAAVEQVYTFVQSTPSPQAWLKATFLPAIGDTEQIAAVQRQSGLVLVEQLVQFFSGHLAHDAQLFPKAKYLEAVHEVVARLEGIDLTAGLEVIEPALRFVADLASSSNGRGLTNATRKEETKDIKEAYNNQRKVLIEQVKAWLASRYQLQLILTYEPETLPLLELLQAFVSDFCDQYLQVKRMENAFEFSDISHLAIRLLEEFPQVRDLYQNRYVEVMVDEYQDTNHTQERLLDLLSRGNNRFMVGDIKQSIYRFRQADPQIFNEKFKRYQIDPTAGRLMLLKENFRSQTEVLEVTNAIFSHLMDEDLGDLVYDDSHQLVAGSVGQQLVNTANRSQYLIYDTDDVAASDGDEGDDDNLNGAVSQGEVDVVVKEIIALHRSGVPFKDITLLVASRSRNDKILRTFDQHGIPLVADGGELTYLQSVDVLVMLETLRAIDNPLRDYALVALLKSPMFAFSEDDLTRISLQASTGAFYEKLVLALERRGTHPHLITPLLAEQLSYFQQYFDQWRSYARGHGLYQLIWRIYGDRLYYDHVGLLPNGEKRQANLYALALRAHQFERTGFKGLGRFIRLIDRILQSDNDLATVPLAPPSDAVSLMTIHKSKGLQFPYVFILNMDKVFDRRDERAKLVISRQGGVGITYLADIKDTFESGVTDLPQVLVAMETTAYQANQQELRRASLSEQMRLLYVAMTRAEKKLYLVGKGSQSKLSERFDGQLENGRLPLNLRESLVSFQDWVLAIAAADSTLPITITFVSDEDLTAEKIGQLERLLPDALTNQANLRQSERISQALERLEQVDSLNQRYHAAINLPTVLTPSQIKARYQPVLDSQELAVMEQATKPVRFERPTLGQQPDISATALGSAVHELMQRLHISPKVTRSDLEKALGQTQALPEVKERIDLDQLAQFFQTDLGQCLQKNTDRLVREAPFALLTLDEPSGEEVVIRGIIDGFVRLDDRLVLFDYKTDKYQDPSELVERYRDQMSLYAQALRQAYGLDEVEQYLVLLGGPSVNVVRLDEIGKG